MQVHGQHAVHTHGLQQVGHDLGRDRHARGTRTAVLAGVAVVGDDGLDALGGSALERVYHDEQFHQVVVGRGAGGLDDEDITCAHVLLDFHRDFAVGETAYLDFAQGGAQALDHFFGKTGVGVAGEDEEVRGGRGHFGFRK